MWKWQIDKNSIGLLLSEEFTDLDEEFSALAPSELVCLPNDYLCVIYNGILDEDIEEYTLGYVTEGSYIKAKGNFLSGYDDYDRIYIGVNGNSTSGIFSDNGLADNDYIGFTIKLGDTNSVLNTSTGQIVINDFEVNFDLDWTNVTGDDNYLTKYGILVENPVDAVDDNYFKLSVPEEQFEGSLVIKQGKSEEPVCDVDNLELCLDETTCTGAEGYWYSDVCNVEEETTEA